MYVLHSMTFFLFKVNFSCKSSIFLPANYDQNLGPHWAKKLDSDPLRNQCGSTTQGLRGSWFLGMIFRWVFDFRILGYASLLAEPLRQKMLFVSFSFLLACLSCQYIVRIIYILWNTVINIDIGLGRPSFGFCGKHYIYIFSQVHTAIYPRNTAPSWRIFSPWERTNSWMGSR